MSTKSTREFFGQINSATVTDGPFDDLLKANKRFSYYFPHGFDGIAHEGALVLTCMDSRLLPLEMFGLHVGEAKILRTPGGILTNTELSAMIMGVHSLGVNRILIVPHTKCAAASSTEESMREKVRAASGIDPGDFVFGVVTNQLERLQADVEKARSHPLIGPFAAVGGFLYDVDTGLVEHKF